MTPDTQSQQLPLEIGCDDTRRMLETAPSTVWLLDCREPDEFAYAAIAGASLIPMGEIPQRIDEVTTSAGDKQIIVYCHHGMRSLRVANFLRQQGIAGAQSMAGGIDEWSRTIDATIPRY